MDKLATGFPYIHEQPMQPFTCFAPIVIPLAMEDHHSTQPFSLALSLPLGAEGIFTPLEKNRMELLLPGWKKPMTLGLPVPEQDWDPGWHGLDRLLHYFYMHGIAVPGFRMQVAVTEPSIDPLPLLTPLLLQALSEQVHALPTAVKAAWLGRLLPAISCDALAYGLADLSADHIFMVNREEDYCLIAPDPLSRWQKILIRLPLPFTTSTHANPAPFRDWAARVEQADTGGYTRLLRQLGLQADNIRVQQLQQRLGSHEASILTLPLTDGRHHYLVSYVSAPALTPYLSFCEALCKEWLGKEYTLHVVEEKLSIS